MQPLLSATHRNFPIVGKAENMSLVERTDAIDRRNGIHGLISLGPQRSSVYAGSISEVRSTHIIQQLAERVIHQEEQAIARAVLHPQVYSVIVEAANI